MKYVKMLGLLAVAAAALMAFAGTASATLTSPAGTPYSGHIHAESVGATSLTGTITITCQKSTVTGQITTNDAKHASGPVETLTFEECGNHTVTVVNKGTLTLTNEDPTTATVFSTGAEVTVLLHSAFLGTVHCIYTTNSSHIGTFTESDHDPDDVGPILPHTTATLHLDKTSIPRTATDGACGEHATWEGTYVITTPDHLYLS